MLTKECMIGLKKRVEWRNRVIEECTGIPTSKYARIASNMLPTLSEVQAKCTSSPFGAKEDNGSSFLREKFIREQAEKRENLNTELSYLTAQTYKFNESTNCLNNNAPKNDYSQNFVNTGQLPQNFVRDPGLGNRFEEYPRLRELIRLKDEQITKTNSPVFSYRSDVFSSADLFEELGSIQFDVILIRPPVPDCNNRPGEIVWSWSDVANLPIEKLTSPRSFVFIWSGSGVGLDEARSCLKKWGFRRCEDICWIKTNKTKKNNAYLESSLRLDNMEGMFQRSKEHCLMGIRGTVRRSMDADFIHANVDIDLIIGEDSDDMPNEILNIIEHFCLGRRRLILFGRDCNVRSGWLTIGPHISDPNFDKEKYRACFEGDQPTTTGTSERIEHLRPKSPTNNQTTSTCQTPSPNSTNMQFSQSSAMVPHHAIPFPSTATGPGLIMTQISTSSSELLNIKTALEEMLMQGTGMNQQNAQNHGSGADTSTCATNSVTSALEMLAGAASTSSSNASASNANQYNGRAGRRL